MLRKLFLISLFASCLCVCVRAAEKVSITAMPTWLYKTNPSLDKKPEARDISNGYYLELMDEQVNIPLQTEYTHLIRHIVNESGVENASEVSVSFSPEYQKVIFHKVAVWRDGKMINQLTQGAIQVVQEETASASLQYNGTKRAFIILKDVRKDDRVEVSYSVTGFNPVFGSRFDNSYYFTSSTALCNYFLTLIAPASTKLNFKYFNQAVAPTQITEGATTVYHWNNPATKLWESEGDIPDWYITVPYVSVTEYGNWNEVVRWGLKTFNNYQYTFSPALNAKITDWYKQAKGYNDDFASLALRFVQDQVRYLGLEIGENSHKPHAPEDVFKNRFGDCKDKSLLYSSILQKAGMKAYVALVNTSMRNKLLDATPAPGHFDHAIVAIERSAGTYIFVDPTYTHQGGALINTYVPAYGQALILRDGINALTAIEPSEVSASRITETFWVSKKGEKSNLEVECEYKGGMADDVRSSFAENSIRDLEKSSLQYYASTYESILQDKNWQIKDDSDANSVSVTKTYAIPTIWKSESGADKFSVLGRRIYEQLPNPKGLAKGAPLALSYPVDITNTIAINFYEDWALDANELHIKNDAFEFDFNPEIIGSRVVLTYHLKTFKDHISPEALDKYKEDYKKMVDNLEYEFSYDNGNGKTQLRKSDPTKSLSNKQMAMMLVIGVGIFLTIRHFLNK
ncbi:DUF3857 domain-containing protein [Pinibacter aurantiacus]|uniref:DUF3857 domain-containing protein n=1 Tax=Pinibacter aurantiacus TaxID=2851599 RepID=A0A9E2SCR6_9BACT|nr:DUF3857 domain-containing protein [Pinibacter aurantiacus]MBV4359139.1 DUF3857 domain-containing protein [Pinibacter aurantiacus]